MNGAIGCDSERHIRGRYRHSSQLREMSEPEKAYVGAMVDGEGWIGAYKTGRYTYHKVTVVNTSLEIISALLRATGVGAVGFRDRNNPRWKPCWEWTVNRRGNVLALAKLCSPYSFKLQELSCLAQ